VQGLQVSSVAVRSLFDNANSVLDLTRTRNYQLLCFHVTSPMSVEVKEESELEIAHVLFIDIVGYSKLSINDQRAAVDENPSSSCFASVSKGLKPRGGTESLTKGA
jgi:hypothetical protein